MISKYRLSCWLSEWVWYLSKVDAQTLSSYLPDSDSPPAGLIPNSSGFGIEEAQTKSSSRRSNSSDAPPRLRAANETCSSESMIMPPYTERDSALASIRAFNCASLPAATLFDNPGVAWMNKSISFNIVLRPSQAPRYRFHGS